ncbi:MAG: FHA domain-containing protein [Planctomycetes bacterium]|nr:FHA domain-containing protein [Planctomycetota bacterium]
MNDPLIARFADACGANAPLDLRVDLAGGGVLAEGSVTQPFTLIGRDDACDVTLSDPEINPRHAWLQVLGGRVFAADLGSRTGLVWPSGARGPGWLDVGTPVRIGPFLLHLRAPTAGDPCPYSPDYNPLASDPAAKDRPGVALEFKNGRRAKDRWQVNRLLTLIGRAADCKIHLTADDIAQYHCGLVSTPTGLWVVDLSGRGVVVNGERMRVAPLAHGAELWVGRFLIGCQSMNLPPTPRPAPPDKNGRLGPAGPAGPRPAPPVAGDARIAITPAPLVPPSPVPAPLLDDGEVELGAPPEADGLTGSHIMSDAFRQWGTSASGPMSNPILVSGSGPKPPAVPPGSALAGLLDDSSAGASDDWSVTPLLRQMADLHARTVAEFQQALALLGHAFERVRRDHLAVLQHELIRIQDLTADIHALEREVARQALESGALDRARQLAADPTKPADPRSGAWVPPSTRTPLPDPPPPPRPVPDPEPPPRTLDRLAALHQERATRWQALIALFSGS